MQKKEKTLSPAAEFLIRTLLDPILLYTTLIMSVLMYHYYDKSMTQFVVASYVVTYFLFRLFDFMNKRKIIGGVLYIFTGYLFYLAVVYFGRRGWDYYEEVLQTKNISYGLWFITPQLALDYNIWYSRLTFMLFSFFMASVIYYFTRIRYRVFMGFLIFIIPFLIYGKEYEKMPVIFIILLAASYIAVMVYCRQLHNVGNVTVRTGVQQIIPPANGLLHDKQPPLQVHPLFYRQLDFPLRVHSAALPDMTQPHAIAHTAPTPASTANATPSTSAPSRKTLTAATPPDAATMSPTDHARTSARSDSLEIFALILPFIFQPFLL